MEQTNTGKTEYTELNPIQGNGIITATTTLIAKSLNNNSTSCPCPQVKKSAKIQIWIEKDTVLSYQIPERLVRPDGKQTSRLSLCYPLAVDILEGTKIKIGGNTYLIVSEFTNDVNWLQQLSQENALKTITIPVGTQIVQDNGIAVVIAQEMQVEMPTDCSIELNAKTKLQQYHHSVKLTVDYS